MFVACVIVGLIIASTGLFTPLLAGKPYADIRNGFFLGLGLCIAELSCITYVWLNSSLNQGTANILGVLSWIVIIALSASFMASYLPIKGARRTFSSTWSTSTVVAALLELGVLIAFAAA